MAKWQNRKKSLVSTRHVSVSVRAALRPPQGALELCRGVAALPWLRELLLAGVGADDAAAEALVKGPLLSCAGRRSWLCCGWAGVRHSVDTGRAPPRHQAPRGASCSARPRPALQAQPRRRPEARWRGPGPTGCSASAWRTTASAGRARRRWRRRLDGPCAASRM
jgi:hypothetical protein